MKSGVIGACADRAADAVGAEVASAHGLPCSLLSWRDCSGRRASAATPPAHRPSRATRARARCARRAAPPAQRGRHAGRQRARSTGAAGRAAPQRRLARPAHQQRQRRAPAARAGARSSCEVVLDGLAEADARVEHDALGARRPRACSRVDRARAGRRATSRDHVVVARRLPASSRLAAHVHQADAAASDARPPRSSAPGARSAAMSLTMSAPRSSAARITSGLLVSTDTGTPSVQPPAQHRQHARAAPPRAAPARRPGGVDSPPMSRMSAPSRTSRSQCAIARVGVGVPAAVGERIGRDVDDAHHPRPRQVDREAAWSARASMRHAS